MFDWIIDLVKQVYKIFAPVISSRLQPTMTNSLPIQPVTQPTPTVVTPKNQAWSEGIGLLASYNLEDLLDFSGARPWTWLVFHHTASADGKINDAVGIEKFHRSWRYKGPGSTTIVRNGKTITISPFDVVSEAEGKALLKLEKKVEAPWPTVGYHFFIELREVNGEMKVVFVRGCPLSQIGYHTKGFNERAVGIAVVGSYDSTKLKNRELVGAAKWDAYIKVIKTLRAHFDIDSENTIGHRESYAKLGKTQEKTCPGTGIDCDEVRKLT